MRLSFYGGVQQVTGSNFLLEHNNVKILIDCGLFQGSKFAETLNYQDFAYKPNEINFVLLTHSHADHTGRLPKLYKDGFRGKVYATKPTIDLSVIALDDNLDLIKEEAHKDGHEALFGKGDLHEVFIASRGVDYGEELDLGNGIKAIFHDAGHILGSAIIEINWSRSASANSGLADRGSSIASQSGPVNTIYFSGDLGNYPTPLLRHYDMPNQASYIVAESTYGDRIHDNNSDKKEKLKEIIGETVRRGGTVIIPSFAIERTQDLIYQLNELIEHEHFPSVPIFIDSPLAIKLTKVYKNYENYFNKQVIHDIRSGDDIFNFPSLRLTYSSQESKAINNIKGPKVIVAGSGMSLGGRILFHERQYLPDPNSTILFVGYQVEGSPGRQILDGKKEVRILGQHVAVNCQVSQIEGYSAHADQAMMLDWIGKAKQDGNLKKVFITHGEYHSSSVLGQKIKDKLGVEAVVPEMGESFEL